MPNLSGPHFRFWEENHSPVSISTHPNQQSLCVCPVWPPILFWLCALPGIWVWKGERAGARLSLLQPSFLYNSVYKHWPWLPQWLGSLGGHILAGLALQEPGLTSSLQESLCFIIPCMPSSSHGWIQASLLPVPAAPFPTSVPRAWLCFLGKYAGGYFY
jgi:hypothetical protein